MSLSLRSFMKDRGWFNTEGLRGLNATQMSAVVCKYGKYHILNTHRHRQTNSPLKTDKEVEEEGSSKISEGKRYESSLAICFSVW